MFPIRRRAPRFFRFALGCAVTLLAAGFVLAGTKAPSYDYPLENATRSAGSRTGATVRSAPVTSSAMPVGAPLPPRVRIQVPFTVQAPTANWDAVHEETCEEASLLMALHHRTGEPLGPAAAEKALTEMAAWEEENGYAQDITVAELARIAQRYASLQTRVVTDFTIEDMKRLLAEGHPIIVPLAGREIGNPYFSGDGPWYHMLVVTGYDGSQFITNDPGTRRGEGYRYPQQRLYDAIHDWTGRKEDIRNGRKVILVLES